MSTFSAIADFVDIVIF